MADKLTLDDLLKKAAKHVAAMTPAEREEMWRAQAQSFARSLTTGRAQKENPHDHTD